MTTGAGLDGEAKRLASLGQPLPSIAEIAQRGPLEAAAGKLMQHRDDALAVMDIRRRDVDRQREAVISFAALRVSKARWILMPLIFLPPSKPRLKQVSAERHERLSMMTALGSVDGGIEIGEDISRGRRNLGMCE